MAASEFDERFHIMPLRRWLAVAIEQLDRFCFSIVRQQQRRELVAHALIVVGIETQQFLVLDDRFACLSRVVQRIGQTMRRPHERPRLGNAPKMTHLFLHH